MIFQPCGASFELRSTPHCRKVGARPLALPIGSAGCPSRTLYLIQLRHTDHVEALRQPV